MKIAESKKGFGVIEIIVASAIATTALFGFLQAGFLSLKLLRNEKANLEATLLAKETLEATRSLRDESWADNIAWRTNISNPSPRYYPVTENGKWKLATTSPGFINGKYDRYVVFEKTYRDSQDRIVSSGGTEDAGTRKAISRVEWLKGSATTTAELSLYLTDFQNLLAGPKETKTIFFEDAVTDGDLANFPDPTNSGAGDPAQSFTTAASPIEATKAELLLKKAAASPSDVYLELRTSVVGTVIGTSSVITSSSISGTNPAWIEFRFPDPVFLKASTVYYLRLRSIPDSTVIGNGTAGPINWLYRQSAGSPYAGGSARRYIGRQSNPADEGQLLDQYDFGFRIYALQ